MAKLPIGQDPYQSVNLGREGTGAAYINKEDTFTPQLLTKGFDVINAKNQLAAKQKAATQAEAKKQLELQRAKMDGWQLRDGKVLGQMSEDLIKEGARLLAAGQDPFQMEDYVSQLNKAEQIAKQSKENEVLYKDLYDKTWKAKEAGTLDETDAATNFAILEKFAAKSPFERTAEDLQGLIAPMPMQKAEAPIDWNKGFEELISKTKADIFEQEVGDKTTISESVPKERSEARWKNYTATPDYNEQVKAYQSTFQISEDEAKKMAKSTFIASLPRKDREKYDEEQGGLDINFGGGTISSNGVTAFYSPDAYNKFKDLYPFQYKELANFEKRGEIQMRDDGAIMFKPSKSKSGSPKEMNPQMVATADGTFIKFKPNAVLKKNDGTWVAVGQEDYEHTEPKFNAQGVQVGTTQTKRAQPIYLTINDNNKIEFEQQWLGGVSLEEALEGFKSGKTQPTADKKPKDPLGIF